jgi:hypothetical protein
MLMPKKRVCEVAESFVCVSVWLSVCGGGHSSKHPHTCMCQNCYCRFVELKTSSLTEEVPAAQGGGVFATRTPESGLAAATERLQRAADQSYRRRDGRFDPYIKGEKSAIFNLSADGFTVPNFVKQLINYVQANLRVNVDGADSSGYMSSHIPLMLGRAKESYEAYKSIWPYVEAPFLSGEDRKPITKIEVCTLPNHA